MSMLDDIGGYLAANGVGVLGATLFLGDMPENPDICVALYKYAGESPITTHDGQVIEQPGLHVELRDTSASAAEATSVRIESLLHALSNRVLGDGRYLYITAEQSSFPLGRDEQKRLKIAQNYKVMKAR